MSNKTHVPVDWNQIYSMFETSTKQYIKGLYQSVICKALNMRYDYGAIAPDYDNRSGSSFLRNAIGHEATQKLLDTIWEKHFAPVENPKRQEQLSLNQLLDDYLGRKLESYDCERQIRHIAMDHARADFNRIVVYTKKLRAGEAKIVEPDEFVESDTKTRKVCAAKKKEWYDK